MTANSTFLSIDATNGRVTRYERTQLVGMRIREAGQVDILNYNSQRPIAEETVNALENFRKVGALA